jgi:hypothetical protein
MANKTPLSSPSTSDIAHEIQLLTKLKPAELDRRWSEVFEKELPGSLPSDLIVRQLAWRLQEEAFGGHDRETLRLLDAIAGRDADKIALYRRLKPGTSVVREYKGVRHVVTISEGGFIWQGKSYGSLSKIAREITGARWNGPRFFGLRVKENERSTGESA